MAKQKSENYEFVSALLADKERRKSIESVPCEIFEADDDCGFRFAFVDNLGVVALEFYSHGLAEWALNHGTAVMRSVIADTKINSESQIRTSLSKRGFR